MKVDPKPPQRSYEVARRLPLVVLARIDESNPPSRLAEQLAADFPDERFIGIVAQRREDVAAIVAGLAPLLAEMIFTASSSPGSIPGAVLATQALDETCVGQDFVFTVPRLPDAIDYAIDVLAATDRHGWEGTAVLAAGSESTVQEAWQTVARPGAVLDVGDGPPRRSSRWR